MTAGASRRAAQQQKIAAMTPGKRVASVVGGTIAAFVACLVVNLVLSGEPGLPIAIGVALAIGLVMSYQYLIQPRRADSSKR